jgi:ribonucleotide monophosphatase NagD (HAD superfamily)
MNLAYRVFGKPHREAYLLAEDALQAQASKLWNAPTCSKIFAIGDNPSADIRGANRQGDPWVSVLVRTGVFNGGLNCPVDPAHIVVDNVEDAILTAMNHCRRDRWHSLR